MEVAEIRGASSRLLNRAHQAEEAATDRHDTKQHEESSGKKQNEERRRRVTVNNINGDGAV